MKMINLTIDNRVIKAQEGATIFQIAQENGIAIPHLCYDPRLDPFTSCWLCVVELKGFPRLVPSCTAKAAEGMEVFTQSERVISARKTCLELLLSDHYGDCIAPCQKTCPDNIDIQGYLALIAVGKYRDALELIREVNPLPLCVGRVCPRFCEKECRRNLVDKPVAINYLKRFASEHGYEGIDPSLAVKGDTGKRVAVIGAGPAGLTAAHFLRLKGHRVTIYEANPRPGGMMMYGIPEYRLPKREMDREIALISSMGVRIEYGKRFGRDITLEKLRAQGYGAILLCIGAWSERRLGCDGEELDGVVSGIGLLYKIASGEKVKIGKKVSVIGGGNTAIDCARTCLRIGAEEVHLIYRRSREEMPANEEEVHEAELEGVKLHFLSAPTQVEGCDRKASLIRCIRMELGEPDASGRRSPVPIEGSEYSFDTDMVIAAIGQFVGDQDTLKGLGIGLTRSGAIKVDEKTMQTNIEDCFSAGDCVSGAATVIEAIAGGRRAAAAIDLYLRDELGKEKAKGTYNHSKGDLTFIDKAPFDAYEKVERAKMPALAAAERLKGFAEVELGLSVDAAQKEALRCLSCGCEAVFDCKLREYATASGLSQEGILKGKYNLYDEREEHPFIFRDRNKCVRCGLCVRMCTEVEGACAYGFVNRGFISIIDPPLGLTLQESACDSCGLCLSTCPTGALEYRPGIEKIGPWSPQTGETVCTLCSMGCGIIVKSKAGICIEVTPKIDNGVNQGKLCWKGVFGWEMAHSQRRITAPMRINGKGMEQTGWADAMQGAATGLKEVMSTHGPHAIALLASPRLSLEESILFEEFAKGLGLEGVYRPGIDGAIDSTGRNQAAADYHGLTGCDLFICLGSLLVDQFPVITYLIKDRVKKGAGLAIAGAESPRLTDLASFWVECHGDEIGRFLSLLGAVASEGGLITPISGGIQSLSSQDREWLDRYIRKGSALEFAESLKNAKSPVVVINGEEVPASAALWLCEGIWSPSLRFLPLHRYGANPLQGKALPIEGLKQGINTKRIKGIVAFGHWKGLEEVKKANPSLFIVQSALFRENHGYLPNFLFPASLSLESEGSAIDAQGRMLRYGRVIPAPSGKQNWEVICELARMLDIPLPFKSFEDLHQAAADLLKNKGKEDMRAPDQIHSQSRKEITPEWSMEEIDLYLNREIETRIFRGENAK